MKDSKKKKNEMSLKHETIKGTLIDYRGMSRDFTMVAVSIPMKDEFNVYERKPIKINPEDECRETHCYNVQYSHAEIMPETTFASTYDFKTVYPLELVSPVRKVLSIGVAVRCNRERDNALRGEEVAYGKAVKNAKNGTGHLLYVSHEGMINTKMVRALLEQEAEHFAKDPGSYIKVYNLHRDRYNQTGRIARAEMTTDEYNLLVGENGVKAVKADELKLPADIGTVYTPDKVLNEDEKVEPEVKIFGSSQTYGAAPVEVDDEPLPVDDTHLEPDVEPDIPTNDEPEETGKKYMSPMQQRLQRMSGKK